MVIKQKNYTLGKLGYIFFINRKNINKAKNELLLIAFCFLRWYNYKIKSITLFLMFNSINYIKIVRKERIIYEKDMDCYS